MKMDLSFATETHAKFSSNKWNDILKTRNIIKARLFTVLKRFSSNEKASQDSKLFSAIC